ncbi:crotonobetaine/carnitine-CoA ligase [Rhodospirillales bacterium URHD0017]|nr:crotonobetaine/carnitine-CoA ligase [Rhodospirillales bacterium URHD0017]
MDAAMTSREPLDASRFFAPGDRSVAVMLQAQARKFGAKPLVQAGETSWSFAETPELAARSAGRLHAAGLRQGDRVALICENRPEFIEIFLGAAWLGAILVPINTASRGLQLRHILEDSGARLMVIEAALLGALEHVDLTALPLETIWVIDSPSGVKAPAIARPLPAAGEAVAAAPTRPSDTLAILYTSGTTGPSKGVCCPHAQFFWWGVHTAHLLGVGGDDVLCTTLPLFHTNALNTFFQALITGATAIFESRFSASAFFSTLAERRATVTYLLGAMVPILLSREAAPAEHGHRTRIALAPGVPGHFHAEFTRRTGIAILDGYGSTETNFVIGSPIAECKPGTMGRLAEGFYARVVDDEDNEVPDGTPGELMLRAAAPFAFATGYFGTPEKTVEAWRNLWFHTGDRVVREADGYYKFVDRLKDAIRRRGENVSSFEVEQVLLSHPEIATAAAYPVRSELAEDEVMAAIVRQPGSALDEVAIIRFCESRMAYFAVPRFLEFVDVLPATENGKIQKYKLRDRGITDRTWDREAAGITVKRR